MIVLGIAMVNRLIQLFEVKGSSVYESVFVSSIVLLSIACIVSLVMTFILSVVRFYQGLYSTEGYLSHTLPVTPSQHIFAKLLVSLIFVVGTILSIFIAINIATLGDVNIELYKALGYLIRKAFAEYGFHAAMFSLEGLIWAIVSMCNTLLIFYFCLSIGQLAPRKKVLLAFGVLFALYIVTQILTTIVIIIVAISPIWFENLYDSIMTFFDSYPYLSMYLMILFSIMNALVQATVFFLISKTIMKRKLNLT